MNLSTYISQIKDLSEKEKQLKEERERLTKPIITDMNMIPILYAWFKDIEPGGSRDSRMRFVYIICCLYCPRFLAGEKLSNGLRGKLSELFPEISITRVSQHLTTANLSVRAYRAFREETETALNYLIQRYAIYQGCD